MHGASPLYRPRFRHPTDLRHVVVHSADRADDVPRDAHHSRQSAASLPS